MDTRDWRQVNGKPCRCGSMNLSEGPEYTSLSGRHHTAEVCWDAVGTYPISAKLEKPISR